jgi:hypothetical protein
MTYLLRLILLVPLGYVAAIIAAALTLTVSFATADWELYPVEMAFLTVSSVFFVGAASFLFALVAIIIAEVFRFRSVFYFVIFGGALGFGFHLLALTALFDQRVLAFPAAGFVGGFVYWLIAGRLSGFDREPNPGEPA